MQSKICRLKHAATDHDVFPWITKALELRFASMCEAKQKELSPRLYVKIEPVLTFPSSNHLRLIGTRNY